MEILINQSHRVQKGKTLHGTPLCCSKRDIQCQIGCHDMQLHPEDLVQQELLGISNYYLEANVPFRT